MANLDALVELSRIARGLLGNVVLRKLLSHLAVLIGLIMITAMMVCLFIAGCFYDLYIVLMRHGFEQEPALAITGGCVILFILILAFSTFRYVRRIRNAFVPKPPKRLQRIVSAFMDGFRQPHNQ